METLVDGHKLLLTELPKNQWIIRLSDDNQSILAATHEHGGGYYWHLYLPSDLPNSLISLDDLERFGINITDGKAFPCPPTL
jgi:hypothetical protein